MSPCAPKYPKPSCTGCARYRPDLPNPQRLQHGHKRIVIIDASTLGWVKCPMREAQ